METDRLKRDLVSSVRLPFTRERRLAGGALVALGAFVLWVGVSGVVLRSGVAISGGRIGFEPRTPTTTLAVVIGAVLWVVGPAGLATYLLVEALTDGSGNLAHYYRVQFPLVLVAVPLVAVGLLAGLGVALGRLPGPVLIGLVGAAWFLVVRTLAYSYRVFSLSTPRVVQAMVFESACVLAATLLAVLGTLFGRASAVTDVAEGLDAALGTSGFGALVSGPVTVGGVTAPGLPALAAGFPVLLAVAYVVVQIAVGLVVRGRAETVPRSRLRTGQRYPAFARPDAGPSDRRQTHTTSTRSGRHGDTRRTDDDPATRTDDSGGPAGTGARTGDSGMVESSGAADGGDHPNHTKVFTPPTDTDLEAETPAGDTADGWNWGPSDSDDEQPFPSDDGDDQPFPSDDGDDQPFPSDDGDDRPFGAGDGDGYECPSCGDTFSGETQFAYCPTCGTELDPA